MKIGVSQCLLGVHCTYNGKSHPVDVMIKMNQDHLIVPVCPEVLGGLTIPRDPAEIQSVNPLKVETCFHQDVTEEYVKGAQRALEIFQENHIEVALLKFRSPSCGCDGVYDGTFQHKLIHGQGVFAKMCHECGIQLFHENQIEEFLKYIGKEDDYGTYFKDSTSI